MIDKNFCEKIISYRAKHNLSGKEFAEMCKITVQTLYNVENGIQSPSKLTVRKIINAMNDKNYKKDGE